MKKYAALALTLCFLSVQASEFTKKNISLKNKLLSIVAAEIITLPVTAILVGLSWSSYRLAGIDYSNYLKFKGLSKDAQYAKSFVDCISTAHSYRGNAEFKYVMCGVFPMLALASAVYVPYWLYKQQREKHWTLYYNILVDCLGEIKENPLRIEDSGYQQKVVVSCKNLIAWKVKNWQISEKDKHDIVMLLEEIQKHI